MYIIIRGSLGCGKTTIAKKVANEINAEYISIDKILEENNLESDIEDGFISQKSFIKANSLVAEIALSTLNKGLSVVFDGNFYWKSQINDIIQKLHFPHHVFTLRARLETCIERDRKRAKPLGQDAVVVVYRKTSEFDFGTVIDVNKSIEDSVKEIVSVLNGQKHKFL